MRRGALDSEVDLLGGFGRDRLSREMDAFTEMARATLALAGMEVSAEDLEVMGLVAQAFEPGIRALDAVELSQLPLEGDLDPGRPPRPAPGRAGL
jgi:hypothetical protein